MRTKATEPPLSNTSFIPLIQQNMLHYYKRIREGEGHMELEEQTLHEPRLSEKEWSAQGEVEDEPQQYDPYPYIITNHTLHRNDHSLFQLVRLSHTDFSRGSTNELEEEEEVQCNVP
jgi:hypothetical protein